MAFSKRWDLTVSSQIEGTEKHRHIKVGAVFLNEKGNLSIKLDPGVALVSGPGIFFNGFPPREYQPGQGQGYQQPQQRAPQQQRQEYAQPGQGGDNVPF